MSLLEQLAATTREILTNTDDFAVAMTLTDPFGVETQIAGLQTDIALSVDPSTGVAVAGRRASVALSTALLEQLGISLPASIPEDERAPWRVSWTPPTGGRQIMRVVETVPDKLGCVVLHLEGWRP